MQFKIKIGLIGFFISLATIVGLFFDNHFFALDNHFFAFPYYSLVLIFFPFIWIFSNFIVKNLNLIVSQLFYPFFLIIASFLWFGVGYLIGKLTDETDKKYTKAIIILILFMAVYIFIGYLMTNFLDTRYQLITKEQFRQQDEQILQARLKLWCTEEIGTWTFHPRSKQQISPEDNITVFSGAPDEWVFRGVAESVRICDDMYVISESSSFTEPLQFYLDQRQIIFDVCHATKNPEGCLNFSNCGENLCKRFR